MFIAQRTQARRTQQEVFAGGRFEPEPAGGEHPQEMPARKQQGVALNRAHSTHHAVGPGTDLVRGFASGAAVAEQLPVGALRANVGGATTLILAIVPLDADRDRPWPWLQNRPIRTCDAARCNGLVRIISNVIPFSRSPRLRALCSPYWVSGRSVSPVCWPERLQAVSPCLAR